MFCKLWQSACKNSISDGSKGICDSSEIHIKRNVTKKWVCFNILRNICSIPCTVVERGDSLLLTSDEKCGT